MLYHVVAVKLLTSSQKLAGVLCMGHHDGDFYPFSSESGIFRRKQVHAYEEEFPGLQLFCDGEVQVLSGDEDSHSDSDYVYIPLFES